MLSAEEVDWAAVQERPVMVNEGEFLGVQCTWCGQPVVVGQSLTFEYTVLIDPATINYFHAGGPLNIANQPIGPMQTCCWMLRVRAYNRRRGGS